MSSFFGRPIYGQQPYVPSIGAPQYVIFPANQSYNPNAILMPQSVV